MFGTSELLIVVANINFAGSHWQYVLIITVICMGVIICIAGISFQTIELKARMDSLWGIRANEQFQQANVLDTLPDAIVIAGKKKISYVN
jgi:hypothetical protein